MRIAVGVVIQDRNITTRTEDEFQATYKGKSIRITTNHGYGKPTWKHLRRYLIDVIDLRTGMMDVDTYQDLHCMKDAIRYALEGACLID